MKTKTVFAVTVKSKHFLADMFQSFKNLVGMNLSSYEKMIEDAIEEVLYKLIKSYPGVYDIKIETVFVAVNTAAMIAYGKVNIK